MTAHKTVHVEVMDLAAQMKAAEQPFVLATVVRTVSVTAAGPAGWGSIGSERPMMAAIPLFRADRRPC